MNIVWSLIWELMVYELKLGHNTMEVTKDINHTKVEGAVDLSL